MGEILKRSLLETLWKCNNLSCSHSFKFREAYISDDDVVSCPMCRDRDIRLDVVEDDYAEVVTDLQRHIDEKYPPSHLNMNY